MPRVKYSDWKQFIDKDIIATVDGVRHMGTLLGVNPYRSVACGAPPWMLATPEKSVYFDPDAAEVNIDLVENALYFTSLIYDCDDIERWARDAGMVRMNERINQAQITFALLVAARCAAAADRYDSCGRNAGDDIRALFGLQ